MRKTWFLAILAIAFLFIGCSVVSLDEETFYLGDAQKALSWISNNIEYQKDGSHDHWQLPSETLKRGEGDCEDFALLTMSALRSIGQKTTFVWMYRGKEGHAAIRMNGKIYNPETEEFIDYESQGWTIYKELNFQTALDYAKNLYR